MHSISVKVILRSKWYEFHSSHSSITSNNAKRAMYHNKAKKNIFIILYFFQTSEIKFFNKGFRPPKKLLKLVFFSFGATFWKLRFKTWDWFYVFLKTFRANSSFEPLFDIKPSVVIKYFTNDFAIYGSSILLADFLIFHGMFLCKACNVKITV